MSLGTTPRTSSRAAETGAGVAMSCLLSKRPSPSGEGEGRVRVAVCSGDLDDAGLHLLEAVGHLRIVAGHHQLLLARERVDGLEGVEHLGEAGDDLHGLARLHVVVEVRGVGGEHHRAPLGLHAHDLKPRGVPAYPVHAEPGEDLAVPLDHTDTLVVVEGDQPGQDLKSTRLNSSHEWISYAVFCW